MPAEDVSDLREVVDAINRLCETMKSSYEEPEYEDCSDVVVQEVDSDMVSPTEVVVKKVETQYAERWSDTIVEEEPIAITEFAKMQEPNALVHSFVSTESNALVEPMLEEPATSKSVELEESEMFEESVAMEGSDVIEESVAMESEVIEESAALEESVAFEDLAAAPCEPTSEMYYTASSEVSLLSDTDLIEKVQNEDSDKDKDDRNIIAGHVAAMRERFESMTRANTPCPDLVRSLSPSLDVFRNITPSPDFLDKS